ncbi:MAG: cation diffusion facilitator family transporter [Actinomycetota bacterium]|nr:cation diffusion facilitator family transporter [Actinomycetota bacterium]
MGHAAHPAVGHAGERHRWRLALAFGLIAAFFVVELVYGVLSGSLALISDAGHMAADVVALGAALLATRIATRVDTTGRRTYGSYRAEVFASLLAVLLMLGASAFVFIAAVGRLGSPAEIAAQPILIVGAIGIVLNVAVLLMLRAGAGESLNVKGAYLEVVADTASSVGVLVAGLLIAVTGASIWDSIVALGIGLFVVVRALSLGRQVLAVLAQHVPAGIDPDSVAADLQEVEGVQSVHDLHLWTLTSGMHVATVHLVTGDLADSHGVLDRARELLRSRHGIAHATLQIEPADHQGCAELGW